MPKSIDVVVAPILPTRVDWDALYTEFVLQEVTTSATTFLRDIKGWPVRKVSNGNTIEHTRGWSKRRAEKRIEITSARMDAANDMFSDLLPDIKEAKAAIFNRYLDILYHGERVWVKTGKNNYGYVHRKLNLRDMSHILNKMKTELGEPIVITKEMTDQGGGKDPALTVLMAMGIIVNGRSQDNGAGTSGGNDTEVPPTDAASSDNVA